MQDSSVQSRRTFIKAAGATLALGAAAGLSVCSAASASENVNDSAQSVSDIQWDEEFDVIVVGAGVAGMSSALTVATEGNGATVLLIEKGADAPQGCSAVSGGRCIWTNDPDGFFTYMKGLYGNEGTVSDDMLHTFAEGATENLNWILSFNPIIEEMTIEDPGTVSASQPNCYPEYPELDGSLSIGNFRVGKRVDGGEVTGPTHVALFLMQCVTEDYSDAIDFRLGTSLTALIQDPDSKAILGAVIENDGKSSYVKADKGVIMCLGGFESNPVMRQNYLSNPTAVSAGIAAGNTGDGHRICQKICADFWHMSSCAGFWLPTWAIDGSGSTGYAQQYGITVGTNGRRFFMDLGGGVSGPAGEVGGDLRTAIGVRHGHMNFGGEWPHMPMPSVAWYICDDNARNAGTFKKTDDPVAAGGAYTADSIEELAALIDVPEDELVKTVDTWNGFCATGDDIAFYRPSSYMANATIDTPPFYACPCRPQLLNTDGGPVRNVNAQIVDTEGEPIPNLYSAGEFGSIWSNMYQGACNLAEGMIFGRIAVRDMLGLGAREYENVYTPKESTAVSVASLDDFTDQLGITMLLPAEATDSSFYVYSDTQIAEARFNYKGASFTQCAKLTDSLEDVSDSAKDSEKDFDTYMMGYTKPASQDVATYTWWYDDAYKTSRSVKANSTQDELSLQTITEALMGMYAE